MIYDDTFGSLAAYSISLSLCIMSRNHDDSWADWFMQWSDEGRNTIENLEFLFSWSVI